MIRRISTKLVLAVLAAVVVPFLGFAVFVDVQLAERLTRHVVQQTLLGLAQSLADTIDDELDRRNQDIALWAKLPWSFWALEEYELETDLLSRLILDGVDRSWSGEELLASAQGRLSVGEAFSRRTQTENFDRFLEHQPYDLLLLIEPGGRLVTCNSRGSDGELLDEATVLALFERSYADEAWFHTALAGRQAGEDQHLTTLLPRRYKATSELPGNYQIGLAAPVWDPIDETRVAGVLYGLVNWSRFHRLISTPVVQGLFQGFVGPDDFPSAYAWIWRSDGATIIAHKDPSNYQKRVDGPEIDLPQLVQAARSADWALYPEYSYRGARKNAAFKHTKPLAEGGFDWVVGVGIDNDDIYAPLKEMRSILYAGTAVVLLTVVLWTMVIARRTTQPIVALREHTRRVAGGDLEARIEIASRDELGELGAAFNRMTSDLAEKTEQLIRAEKDAAWREMARQIAHDIKGPLTPIKLSIDLMRRAKAEHSKDYESIEARTMELLDRQVENLRDIATDFYEFTGGQKPKPVVFDVGALLDEVLQLHHAWAERLGVTFERRGGGGEVFVDPAKLRRVLTNLVSNALEAMHDGGRLEADVRAVAAGEGRPARVAVEIRDSGKGLTDEVRAHLFDPYFTTRSEGTGLGLAIAWRVIEEMKGTLEVESREGTPGTLARVTLVAYEAAQGRGTSGAGESSS